MHPSTRIIAWFYRIVLKDFAKATAKCGTHCTTCLATISGAKRVALANSASLAFFILKIQIRTRGTPGFYAVAGRPLTLAKRDCRQSSRPLLLILLSRSTERRGPEIPCESVSEKDRAGGEERQGPVACRRRRPSGKHQQPAIRTQAVNRSSRTGTISSPSKSFRSQKS